MALLVAESVIRSAGKPMLVRERSTLSALQKRSSAIGARRPGEETRTRMAGNTSAILVRLEVLTWRCWREGKLRAN